VSHDLDSNNSALGSFKGSAIILISGNGEPDSIQKVLDILSEYSLEIVDQQSIYMSGRLIAAVKIHFDPAHADAIERELISAMKPLGLDVALEIL
jgi:predicted amino acid-binding ACT domain protein